MRIVLAGILMAGMLPGFAAAQIPGEVSCDKGVDMARVQALVKRTVEALRKDQATVIQQINSGDKKWKDGDYYMVVFQGTKALAHGYMSCHGWPARTLAARLIRIPTRGFGRPSAWPWKGAKAASVQVP